MVAVILTVAVTATDDAPAKLPFRPAPPIDLVDIGSDDARVRLSNHLGTPSRVVEGLEGCEHRRSQNPYHED